MVENDSILSIASVTFSRFMSKSRVWCPGARFSKVPIINGPAKLLMFTLGMQDRGFKSFASNMIKLSVNETKWSI